MRDDAADDADLGVVDVAGAVRDLSTDGWPSGYVYGATRYADVILKNSFPGRWADIVRSLETFAPTLDELRAGGGGRTVFVKRFDDSLAAQRENGQRVWGKQNVTIEKLLGLDGTPVQRTLTRGHEIDMFGLGHLDDPLPGVAVEMEWNNKDPFFDRDLLSFQALHHEGAIAVGVIVTRGPSLQSLLAPTVRSKDGGFKYGQSTTHWDKLVPRVNLGGGGECPLLLVGIEPERIQGVQLARDVFEALEAADAARRNWRQHHSSYSEAASEYKAATDRARLMMPRLRQVTSAEDE